MENERFLSANLFYYVLRDDKQNIIHLLVKRPCKIKARSSEKSPKIIIIWLCAGISCHPYNEI